MHACAYVCTLIEKILQQEGEDTDFNLYTGNQLVVDTVNLLFILKIVHLKAIINYVVNSIGFQTFLLQAFKIVKDS